MDAVCGGWGPTKNATKDIQKICDQVKPQVEDKTNQKYAEFTAVKYRDQLVAGENYLIKIHVGGADYIHVLVWQELPCYGGGCVVHDVQQHKTRDDPLVPN